VCVYVCGLGCFRVNLAAKDKMVEPAYQELLSKDIPKPSLGGVTGRIVWHCSVVCVCLGGECMCW
jgi:hypothetical protein